jgi:hypothetical protein
LTWTNTVLAMGIRDVFSSRRVARKAGDKIQRGVTTVAVVLT